MTTPRIRSLVSLAAALSFTLVSGGCASAPAYPASDGPMLSDAPPAAVRFDNGAQTYVRVYLIGEKREWLLGRVEPGAHAMLRIPDAALRDDSSLLSLAVLVGERTTLRAVSEPSAATTMALSVTELVSQRWSFSQVPAKTQLTSLPVGRVEVDHR